MRSQPTSSTTGSGASYSPRIDYSSYRGRIDLNDPEPNDLPERYAFLLCLLFTLGGAVIRYTRLDFLALRIDEGFTLLYQRQSWSAVLGFDGFYAPHPPLFFATAKAADLFVPEEISARFVAALCGTLTIPLLYTLTSRLVNRTAGLVAAFLLMIAPTHVEFSRDGRMYTPVILMVMLAYLALIEMLDEPGLRWAALYGLAITIAIYLDYSAAYGLVPQVILLVLIFRRHGQRAISLVVALTLAAFAYLPWLPQLRDTIKTLDLSKESTSREESLSASWNNIERSVSYVLGLSGRGSNPLGAKNVWDQWPDVHPIMIGFMALVGIGGVLLLTGKPVARLVSLSIALGTPLVTILFSQISPGYAARTVQIALLGWCIAAGAFISWFLRQRSPLHYVRMTGFVLIFVLTVLSIFSLRVSMSGADRYQWRQIAADLASPCAPDAPIIVASSAGMFTDILSIYTGDTIPEERVLTVTDGQRETYTGADRWLQRGPTRADLNDGKLVDYLDPDDPANQLVWVATRLASKSVPSALTDLGYKEIIRRSYLGATLSLWSRLEQVEGDVVIARCQ